MDFENDIPKYKKKSKKHAAQKADHKHDYETVLIKRWLFNKPNGDIYYCSEKRCVVCGKLTDCEILETVPMENGFLRVLTNEEIYEKYKDCSLIDETVIKECE